MASGGALAAVKSRKGIPHKTISNEELSDFRRRSSLRKSLESGLDFDDDEEEDKAQGPVKARFMPFFRKYWPHLKKNKRQKTHIEYNTDERVLDDYSESYKSVNPKWYGKPVEEVDPFIFEDTFCVISKKYNKHYIYRFSCTSSLYLIGPLNPLRRLAFSIITHQWFDILIIITILANCVTLALSTNIYRKTEDGSYERVVPPYEETANTIEYAFLGIYTLEMVLKIIAKGFVMNKFSYLRNKWNILDFIVVTSGYFTIALPYIDPSKETSSSSELEVLRTFRVLRAVKTISILPGLRMMINALLSSVVQLLEVMALTLFCLMIFALFALEVYMGKLRQKCVADMPFTLNYTSEAERDYYWSKWVDDPDHWETREFPETEYILCGNDTGTRRCQEGYTCLGMRGENPDDGWTSFDNFFASMLSTFQLITLDYWERLYDLVLSSCGPWSLLFFTVVVFLGSYYLLNLMLAVVAMSYENEAHSNTQALSKHQKLGLVRTFSTFSFDDLSKLNIKEMTYYRKRTPSERELLAKKLKNTSLGGKRKPRRAIRRKPANLSSKGKELTVQELETGSASPNVKSAAGSICGESVCGGVSVIGGDSGGDRESAMSPILLRDKSPTPRPSSSASRKGCGRKASSSDWRGVKMKRQKVKTSGGGASVVTMTKPLASTAGGGGKRVSGRVKAVNDKDGNRFILETQEGEEPVAGKDVGDSILNMLGLRKSVAEAEANAIAGGVECEGSPPSPDELARSNSSGGVSQEYEQQEKRSKFRVFKVQFRRMSLMLKTRLRPVVNHCVFEAFITTCIICNTVILAYEHHGMTPETKIILDAGNQFFMAIFSAEAIIKLMALQGEYFQAGWNIFDILIVFVSYIDFTLETFTNLSVIRGFRLLRVFKLAQSWITMKVLLNIIFSTFGALGNLTLVLLIVIYIFAVMGMQVVGGNYRPDRFEEEFPRWNFQDFWFSFMMVFRVLCGEWIEPMWDCLEASKNVGEWKCFLIFPPILIVGNFIVLNLFLALLLNSFNTEELKAQRDKELEATGRTDNLKTIVGMLLKKDKAGNPDLDDQGMNPNSTGLLDDEPKVPTVAITSAPSSPHLATPNQGLPLSPDSATIFPSDSDPSIPEPSGKERFRNVARKVIMKNRKEIAMKAIDNASDYLAKRENHVSFYSEKRGSAQEAPPPLTDNDKLVAPGDCIPKKCWNANCCLCQRLRLLNLSKWNNFRQYTVQIVGNPTFEWLIIVLIIASSITLAFEDKYLDEKPQLKQVLFWINLCFTFIFVIEMLLKWCAMGLWGYFTNAWTILDAFIVLISLVTLYFDIDVELNNGTEKSQLSGLKAFRTFRALRPLRAISRWQGMKIVVNALIYAIPSIFNVLLVCLLFWLVFSIMGVQFFKGKFYRCVDETGEILLADIVPNKTECCNRTKSHNYSWINVVPNFDNVFEGYLSLFQIATYEGWMELMQSAIDATDVDLQPRRDNGVAYYLFFVIFIVFGAFFTLNLFIGVIIDNFNMLKKKYEGNLLEVLLTPSQRHYYTAMKKLGRKKPRKVIKRPGNPFIAPFYDISMSRKFEIAIFVLIFVNMVVMAFEHYGQRQIFVHLLAGFNSFFTTIYALEAVVKIIGLRHYYFTVPWNVFDFVLVLASIVDLLVGDLTVEFPIPPTMLRIVRVFRIGRVLRLVKAAKGIRKLLFALIVSLPALFNIGALLGLITFIYAILGMALFKDVSRNTAIDSVFNFETFWTSVLMLFRLMTAAGWNEVLDALTNVEADCGEYRKIECGRRDEPDCPNRGVAVAYCVTYLIVSYLIVINMYIAIILENFVEANREEEVGIVEDDLEMFYVRWSRYDPQATQFINFDQLSDFLASLDPPLTLPKPNTIAMVAFNLPIARGDKIHCLDILHALVKHVLGQIDDTEEFRKLQEQMERKFQKQFPTRKLLDVVSSTRQWKMEQNAAIVIQRAWRQYRLRKHPPQEKQKGTQTTKSTVGGAHQGGVGNMLNRMGNLLHIGGNESRDKGRRRESIVMREGRGSFRVKRPKERSSESSISSTSPMTKVDTTSGLVTRGSVGDTAAAAASGSSAVGNRGRRLSPSRLSGGSFDVAVNFGNQLSVMRNSTNGPSPLPSCPTTPSSLAEEAADVIVQIHDFQ